MKYLKDVIIEQQLQIKMLSQGNTEKKTVELTNPELLKTLGLTVKEMRSAVGAIRVVMKKICKKKVSI